MPIDIGDTPTGTPPTTGEKLQIRTAIGLGQTDAPTFAGVNLPFSLNFFTAVGPQGLNINHNNIYGASIWGGTNARFAMKADGHFGIVPVSLDGPADVRLYRDDVGIFAQRNGTAKQALRVYNTFLGTTANEWGGFDWLTTANTLRIGTDHGGTGTARPIDFVVGGAAKMSIAVNGNTTVLGSIFCGATSGFGVLSKSYFTSPSDGLIAFFNLAGTDFGRLQLGGTTSAFPAIKRNGTGIDIRLADDSGAAPLSAGLIIGSQLQSSTWCLVGSTSAYYFLNRGGMEAPSDGVVRFINQANNGFTRVELGTANLGISRGTGSPEGIVTALVGSLYLRTDGGAATTLYVKESSPTPSTGWVAK
jgi:hypothetical protein